MPPTIFCCFAHPDDETFSAAATLARAASAGARIILVTATAGDAGYLSEADRARGADLGTLRTRELRCACDVIGVTRLELLGYRDGALAEVEREELVERLRAVADAERPAVWITFGPRGITGHPDHIAIGRAATRLFYDYQRAGVAQALFFPALPPEAAAELGLRGPEARPNARVPIDPWRDRRERALACHASQPDAREQLARERAHPRVHETFYRAFPAQRLTERIDDILPAPSHVG